MARLNPEHGSELHLLRMLGRHRDYFSSKVCEATGADRIEWCDFASGEMRRDKNDKVLWDREWHHLNFLPEGDPARAAWKAAWPTHRPGHNWDAIGRARFGSAQEWLLVEAKANVEELHSTCRAEDANSIGLIKETLDRMKSVLGVAAAVDWTRPYYQFCNRLAALHILNEAGSQARLIHIYFCGDSGDSRRNCPVSAEAWTMDLGKQDRHVGLPEEHALNGRVHKLFIDVRCVG